MNKENKMSMIDIRTEEDENIETIKFSENESVINSGSYIILCQESIGYNDKLILISKSDIPNLIKALNKAKELGWY